MTQTITVQLDHIAALDITPVREIIEPILEKRRSQP
ncbi:hypothetical protein CWATWH0402_3405 [Crocosphaera watsonii WH 0402]|uniref:Uncharacterized protein n=1 Tax=Crocosphaera watsonii WH 0402 TaxID=1284629 RepID=T2JNV5_CROWT|nr:hypothetical protein CWATWH0402_3405 [Crocosphaera watsonii WH 0402]